MFKNIQFIFTIITVTNILRHLTTVHGLVQNAQQTSQQHNEWQNPFALSQLSNGIPLAAKLSTKLNQDFQTWQPVVKESQGDIQQPSKQHEIGITLQTLPQYNQNWFNKPHMENLKYLQSHQEQNSRNNKTDSMSKLRAIQDTVNRNVTIPAATSSASSTSKSLRIIKPFIWTITTGAGAGVNSNQKNIKSVIPRNSFLESQSLYTKLPKDVFGEVSESQHQQKPYQMAHIQKQVIQRRIQNNNDDDDDAAQVGQQQQQHSNHHQQYQPLMYFDTTIQLPAPFPSPSSSSASYLRESVNKFKNLANANYNNDDDNEHTILATNHVASTGPIKERINYNNVDAADDLGFKEILLPLKSTLDKVQEFCDFIKEIISEDVEVDNDDNDDDNEDNDEDLNSDDNNNGYANQENSIRTDEILAKEDNDRDKELKRLNIGTAAISSIDSLTARTAPEHNVSPASKVQGYITNSKVMKNPIISTKVTATEPTAARALGDVQRHPVPTPAYSAHTSSRSLSAYGAERKIKKKLKKKLQKFLVPLLLAYKLKFLMLMPLLIGGLTLLVGSTGMAGFFFALFTAVMTLKSGSSKAIVVKKF